ncbi:hypothetical protein AKJ54_00415 [candidate division MSBL1 archaeon SCGC-AAA382K21]|uniref:ArnR1-like winged helix-turn-helix domain-containing protein n=1 Tax=candidate division MSBL1 archaeon SCGC-AAA382K21 TaxID=1698283 RepID=A0A133VLK2_9EURY|nr:hypothetical protein AKJ54_00415 [candidate division MSBL1 archaeon SCGC-AAA382K21]
MARERRSKLDLYADILEAVSSESRKTHIVYQANLNFKRAEEYLNELMENDLVEIRAHSPLQWTITEKGRDFLAKHKKLRNMLPR